MIKKHAAHSQTQGKIEGCHRRFSSRAIQGSMDGIIFHFSLIILLLVRSCDFVDRSSLLGQANDPRNDTKQREINPANGR
jgi:hypothetical protein